jgi:cytidylate kinase
MLSQNIAIDGPAGAGKSTVARMVANKLNYLYIDSGAMYRALTWKLLKDRICLDDEDKLAAVLKDIEIEFKSGNNGESRIFCNGADVTEEIRSSEVSKAVSIVATKQAVRSRMVWLQREMAKKGRVVMDGRDIGTVVMPEASNKFYLTADALERVKRRFLELKLKGHIVSLLEVQREIEMRDKIDSKREISPLRKAPDAICIDTTGLNPEEVAEIIIGYCGRGICN